MQPGQVAVIPTSKRPPFYGWVIALAASFGTACSISVFIPATISLMVGPLTQAFHWSPQSIFAVIVLVAGMTAVVAPVIGELIDHIGVARMLVLSFVAEGLIVASFKFTNGNILLFYLRYAALAIFATGTTSIAYSTVLSRWFNRRRGLALGISLAGVGFGGSFWSLITQYLFDHVGWRDAFPWMALMMVATMVPLMLLVMRDDPAEMGLHVDGDSVTRETPKALTGLPIGEALVSAQFWLMATSFFLLAIVLYGVMLNLVPLLRLQGLPARQAAGIQAAQWIVIVLGRVCTGSLIDRFFAPHVAIALILMPLAGIAILAAGGIGINAIIPAILVGLAVGAEGDMLSYMTGRYFGLKHYGVIYAIFYGFYGVGTGIGATIVASLAALCHGYGPVLWGLCATLLVIAGMLAMYRRFPQKFSAS